MQNKATRLPSSSSSSPMEILQRPSKKELEVAHILIKFSLQRARLKNFGVPPKWSGKRRRSQVPTVPTSHCHLLHSEGTLIPSSWVSETEHAVTLVPPPLPLPNKAKNAHVGVNICKSETKALSSSITDSPVNENLKLFEQKLAKKRKREELSEALSIVSQQKCVLAKGMEDAMRFYERVKAYKLQLEEKEQELKQLLEQEQQHPETSPVICNSRSLPMDVVAGSQYSDGSSFGFDLNLPPI